MFLPAHPWIFLWLPQLEDEDEEELFLEDFEQLFLEDFDLHLQDFFEDFEHDGFFGGVGGG